MIRAIDMILSGEAMKVTTEGLPHRHCLMYGKNWLFKQNNVLEQAGEGCSTFNSFSSNKGEHFDLSRLLG